MDNNKATYQELTNRISELEAKLAETQWLHDKENVSEKEPYMPFYGDVTELNTERTILDNVGKENLKILTSELMDLLDTSVTIYEKNGDYAYGVFNSGWCQLMDAASRKLCNTDDNKIALNCGKWLSHDDCWKISHTSIITKKIEDTDCIGGIKIYAEPIFAGNEVIGSINIGYGNPPTDNKTLKELADKFSINFETLKQKALAYNPRPDFIIEIAKKRLKSIAKLMGEIVQRKQSEQELKERVKELDCISQFSKLAVDKNNIDDILNELTYLLKKSFLVPEITEVRIKNDGNTYQTDNFRETPFLLQSDIIVEQKKKGIIEIAILQDKTNKPVTFLKEEYKLLRVITERLNSIIERLEINKTYKLLSENISDGIILIEDDKIKYVSPRYAQMFGLNLEELKQIKLDEIFSFIHPDDTERIRNKVYEACKNQVKNYLLEYRTQKANGEYIWVESVLNSEYDENGNRIRTIIRARDITDRKKAEQALKESEEKYRLIAENVSDVIWILNLTKEKFTYISPSVYNIYGYTPEEGMQQDIYQSLTPESANEMIESNGEILPQFLANPDEMSKKIHRHELRAYCKDGSIIWIEITTRYRFNSNNEVEVIGISRDITERKKAEQALKESEEKYRLITENASDVIGILNLAKEKFTYISPSVYNIYGYTSEEVMQQDIYQSLTPESAKEMVEINGEILPQFLANPDEMSKKIHRHELRAYCKDGSIIWIEITTRYRFNSNNEVEVIGISRDITDRKKAEQALKESEEKFKGIFEHANAGIATANFDGRLTNVNKEFEKLLGYSQAELLNMTLRDIIHPDDIGNTNELLKKLFKGEIDNYRIERRYIHKTGGNIWVDLSVAAVKDEKGDVSHFIGMVKDINEKKQAEEALQESEKEFRAIFEKNSSAMLIINAETIILNTNETFFKVTGYTKDEIIGKSWTEIIPENDLHRLLDYNKKRLSNNKEVPDRYDFNFYNKKREIRHGLISISYFQKNRTIIASFLDITDRKQAEETLKESEEKHRRLFETMTQGVVYHDAEGAVISANPAAERILGLSIEQMQNRLPMDPRWKIINEDGTTLPGTEYPVAVALRTGSIFGPAVVGVFHPEKNTNIWTSITVRPLFRTGETKPFRVYAVFEDITDRKKAEQALKESEKKFRQLVQMLGEGVGIVDENETFVFANRAASKIFQTNNLIGKNLFNFITDKSKKVIQEETNKRKSGEESIYDLDIVTELGEYRNIIVTATPYILADNKYIGTFGVFRDITDRKQAEQALQEYSKKLEEANATKDKFFNIIAHDLKNPFNSILGFSNLLLTNIDKYDKDKIKRFVTHINEAGKSTFKLLENLLEWSRNQQNKIPFNPEKTNLYYLAYESYILVNQNAKDKQIEIDLNIPNDIEIEADSQMLNTIIRNLLSNSVKYTSENGKITISAKQINNEVIIEISDTGIGMNEKTKNSLFKIGETKSKAGTNGEHGTGLGLLLCKEFVDKHNGTIHVESKPGEGSTFIVSLPK